MGSIEIQSRAESMWHWGEIPIHAHAKPEDIYSTLRVTNGYQSVKLEIKAQPATNEMVYLVSWDSCDRRVLERIHKELGEAISAAFDIESALDIIVDPSTVAPKEQE